MNVISDHSHSEFYMFMRVLFLPSTIFFNLIERKKCLVKGIFFKFIFVFHSSQKLLFTVFLSLLQYLIGLSFWIRCFCWKGWFLWIEPGWFCSPCQVKGRQVKAGTLCLCTGPGDLQNPCPQDLAMSSNLIVLKDFSFQWFVGSGSYFILSLLCRHEKDW